MTDVTPGPVETPRVSDDELVTLEKTPAKTTTPDPLKEKSVVEDADPTEKVTET